jgi:adenine-specific DNA-methyltransferase
MPYNFPETMPKLDWLTRPEDERAAASVPYRLLEAVPELSYGDEQTENMLIQGNNLEALKALLPFYAGRVKCIYIDPPYNTRSADFAHYDDNLEHTQWLGTMYPRLELLQQLLSEDGVMWVQLDDNEAHYAKVVMDEVFGRSNFLSDVIWQKSYAVRSNADNFSTSTEHILVYAKKASPRIIGAFLRSAEQRARFTNPDSDPRGPWQSITFTISLVSGARGRQFAKTGASQNLYTVESPAGGRFDPPPGRCWARSPEVFRELNADGRIWWGPNGDRTPRLKMFLSESDDGVIPTTLWASGDQFGFNQDGVREVRALGLDFPSPKPERLIEKIIELSSDSGDLILDSFLGSGTTAAVAHKMGRRYIGIEMGEHAETHCVPRLKKVVDGEQGGISEAVDWKGGGGFRFYRLGNPIFDEQGHIHPSIRFDHLAAHIWFSETHTPLAHKRKRSPFLGKHNETAYYLLYNGILGDKRSDGGNVLTRKILSELPAHDGPKVIYGESSRLSAATLKQLGIVFKQTPYDVKAR